MSIDELLRAAAESHRAGRVEEARARYLELLAREPGHPQALNLLGVLLGQIGDWAGACDMLEAATAADPARGEFFANLAEARRHQGQLRESDAAYRRAIELLPSAAALRFGRGTLQVQLGELDEAACSFEATLRLDPASPSAHCRLADVLQLRGERRQAINHYRQALALRGDHVESLINLGNALCEDGQPETALPLFERAVQLRPDIAAAHNNLGTALQDLGRPADAERCYQRAIELEPARAEFQLNLGCALRDQGDWHAALTCCEAASRLAPQDPQAEYRRGTVLLALGRFAEGWPAYEARSHCPQFQIPTFAAPRWRGEPLAGRTLLVYGEQGFGDTLQFVRYLRQINVGQARVLSAVERRLLPLLTSSGYSGLVPNDAPLPPFDCYLPLLSFPHVMGTTPENFPRDVPYLAAEPARVEHWRRALPAAALRVGIAWQGRPGFRGDRQRSIALVHFAPLAAAGATLVSLQQGPGSEQRFAAGFEVVDLGPDVDRDGAFVDTAAVMQSLDLVITSDTAIAHLAGGLGVPVWVALAFVPEWRWMTSGDTSLWYPTMRLFRQTQPGDWPGVFERMAQALVELPPRAGASGGIGNGSREPLR